MEGMRIREATADDKDQVIAIRDDVYEGKDYLAATYDHFMACPDAIPYVGVIDGQIMAFIVAFIVDGGHTVITRAGRVSPLHEGKGYYSSFQTRAIQQPGVSEHALTAVNSNMAVFTESFQRKFEFVLSKEMLRYIFKPHTVTENSLNCESKSRPIRTSTNADLELYMTLDQYRKYLFPDDVIIVNWVPYRLFKSNIPLIGVPGQTTMLTNVDIGNQKGILSIITVYKTKDPEFTANLDIYGSDNDSLVSHVAAQIEFIRTQVDEQSTMCLLVFVDSCLEKSAVEHAFIKFGLEKNVWRSEKNSQIEFSKQLLFRKSVEASKHTLQQ